LFPIGLLLDEIFGENNRTGIITVVHKSEGRQFSKSINPTNEYYLFYSKNSEVGKIKNIPIDEDIKKTFDLSDNQGGYRLEEYLRRGGGDVSLRINKPSGWYPIYVSKDCSSISLERKNNYIEIYPITESGQERTWNTSKETFLDNLKKGEVVAIRQNGVYKIYRKYREQQIIKTHWVQPKYNATRYGTQLLNQILNKNSFNFPKSLYAVKDALKITLQENGTVLDFFAGSGTTGHAVLELNKKDGGNRNFILCTNNENNICEDATWERIKRVSKGYKNLNKEKVSGLGGNIKYLKTDFIEVEKTSDNLRKKMVDSSTDILCLKENTFNLVKDTYKEDKIKIFENSDKYTAILFDLFYFDDFVKELKKLKDKPVSVYVFSYTKDFSKEEFGDLDIDFTIEAIPEKVLETYKKIFNF
jgi:adenine-specific DNA-methyltransferase